jgi:hypothetical protein
MVVGIMADESADTVRETIAAGDITWTCVWDGPSGPVSKLYRVHGFPSMILIGPDGRIASINLTRHNVTSAVGRLLKGESAQ